MNSKVLKDVCNRTNGELYIGVVGSVRSGKSMFIRKFIECKVLPFTKEDEKNKIIDELPQSAEGKTIMTVEPKFVPTIPSSIMVDDNLTLNVRLVDCVGYAMKNSKGYENNDGTPRMVKTPWFTETISFLDASEVGTIKVMENHSNVGIVMTSDGSFGEFSRNDYEENEEKIIEKLKSLNKPFVIVLNSTNPNSEQSLKLKEELEKKYNVKVVNVNVKDLTEADIDKILNASLEEFDISKLDIVAPNWLDALDDNNQYKKIFLDSINKASGTYRKFKDARNIQSILSEEEIYDSVNIESLDPGTGEVKIVIECKEELYDEIIEDLIGDAYHDKLEFLNLIQDSVYLKKHFKKYQACLEQVNATGYAIAMPEVSDMVLNTPSVVKQGGRYGINLQAHAPSIHMIKVDVESVFDPIIGTEEQSKMLIDKLMKAYEEDKEAMWEMEIFGRKLAEVVNEGIKSKLYMMPDDLQVKMIECLEKVINKNKGGILTILL